MTSKRWFLALTIFSSVALFVPAQIFSQTLGRNGTSASSSAQKKSNTIVRVELLTGPNGAGTVTVNWGKTFEKLGYDLRIRRGTVDDKLDIREQKQGTLRIVNVIGELEANGTINFIDRSFGLEQAGQLGEWLRNLETFGAQGSPKGKPLWGLNEKQFEAAFTILSQPFDVADANGKSIDDIFAAMEFPKELPIRWTTAAKEAATKRRKPLIAHHTVAGLTRGTTLAFHLREHGFGMQPLRTPTGSLELVISPLQEGEEYWPIGWPPPGRDYDLAPHMFKPVPVELVDVPLLEVFDAIAERTEIPILVDNYVITQAKINLDEINVSYPNKQTTWSLLLKAITTPSKLTRSFLIDEAGTPFVWVTEFRPTKIKRDR
ncbi:MAG: hypothetical protein O2955_11075 [Planctomycetota bacterium]|nr:hypothetical protein [Planctomycetota bacterium]MDA1213055.1 hypothetical protein [Planctomycetota bacterium]